MVMCTIQSCSRINGFGLTAPTGRTGGRNNWSSDQIWGYTEDILQAVGLSPNFDLVETNAVPNAAAIIHEQKRVLAYNPDWIKQIEATQKWHMYGLLAHEIGHHLQGHTLTGIGSTPPTELEADTYAGFVLARLGASEPEATALWQTFGAQASATHPGRDDRVAAVRAGWHKANAGMPTPTPTRKPEERAAAYTSPR